VIFITGEENEELRLRTLAAGAVDFFYKPFDDEKLLEAVYRAIGRDS
jgi:FixJ family two-component response regulator